MKTARAILPFALAALGALEPSRAAGRPAPAPDPTAAVFDSLAAMDAASRFAEGEHLASAFVDSLERARGTDSLLLARALERQASFRRSAGRVGDGSALRAAERSAAIASRRVPLDVPIYCRAHCMAAILFVDLALGDSALAHARAALVAAEAAKPPDDSILSAIHFRAGQAQRVRTDYAAAVAEMHRSGELMVRRFGPAWPGLTNVATELGRSFSYFGEFDSARVELELAVQLSEQNIATGPERLERALTSLATFERRTGDPGHAVELASRAYELYVGRLGESGPQANDFLSNLATNLYTVGDFARSKALLERVIAHEELTLPRTHMFVIQNHITHAITRMKTGDPGGAGAELDVVDSLMAAAPAAQASNVAYAATVRTLLELDAEHFEKARRLLLVAAAHGPYDMATRSDLAAEMLLTVRGPADRAFADSVCRSLDSLADTTRVALTKNWTNTLDCRARAESRLGLGELAWQHARESEALESRRFRWEVETLPDRSALLHDIDAADPSQLLVELARPGHDDEVRTAWEALIRRRGAIREVVAERRAALTSGDTVLVSAYERWLAASRHHAQLEVAGALGSSDPAARQRFEASRVDAEEAEGRYALLTAHQGDADTVSLARVLARLQPRQTMVAFARTDDGEGHYDLSAFVARGGESPPVLVRLGPEAPVADAVSAWLERLSSPPAASPEAARAAEGRAREAGRRVRERVWTPLLAAIGGTEDVLVVAAGPLRDVPWLALPGEGGRYLAEGSTRLRVLTAERELLRAPAASEGTGLLAVGDPAFDESREPGEAAPVTFNLRRLPGSCARDDQALADLPGARAEAQAVAELWTRDASRGPARLLLGEQASEQRFKELAPGCRAIHLATHGILTRDSCQSAPLATRGVGGIATLASAPAPRRAARVGGVQAAPAAAKPARAETSPWLGREVWLAFAGANRGASGSGGENDGWLTADEVVTLDLRGTDRVVLSACQSGVVERWSSDALLGMRRAFHLAGARAVVASQWPIADEATRAWMEAFYASRSPSAGGALQEACRAVLAQRRARGASTHPFFWAAFTATGD
jgi:CHAT domain-containing protein